MSTDLVRRDELTSLSIPEMQTVSELLAASGFFTDKNSVAKTFVAVLAGQELGIPPFAAINGVHVIQGKPSVGAGLLAAMVKQSGKYDYRVKRIDDDGCTLQFFERSESVGFSTFTIKDAERAGLTRNPTWKQYPQAMLFARTLTTGVRMYCPDVTHGAHFEADPDTPPESTPRPQAASSSEPVAAAPASPVTETVVDAEVIPVQPEPVPVAPSPDDTPNGQDGEDPADIENEALTAGVSIASVATSRAIADVRKQLDEFSDDEKAELKRLMDAKGIRATSTSLIAAMESRGLFNLDGLVRKLSDEVTNTPEQIAERQAGAASFEQAIADGTLGDLPDGATLEDHPMPGEGQEPIPMPNVAGRGRRTLTPKAG